MIDLISVIICTYNPDVDRLNRTIKGLRLQSFSLQNWELIIVDNNSRFSITADVSWHPDAKIVKEQKPGLTSARIRGFSEAKGQIFIMVDDDNVLNPNYLQSCSEIFNKYPKLGAIGGNIFPDFEASPPEWTREFWPCLALRNLGQSIQISSFANQPITCYPDFAPVGAGMAIRCIALERYMTYAIDDKNAIQDRSGDKLTSSGDNEIVIQILLNNYEVGFFPILSLEHLISSDRLTKEYLARLNKGIMESWTLLLKKYEISPWQNIKKWTLPFRKLKSYIKIRAWRGNSEYVRWKGTCGTFKGLAK